MRGRKPKQKPCADAVTKVMRAPEWLSTDAKAEWSRSMPILADRRTLTAADLPSYENYCVAVGQIRAMERIIAKKGHLIETDKGTRINPAVRLQSDAMTRARLLAAELGLTPVSRSRPSIQDNPSDDDSAALGV